MAVDVSRVRVVWSNFVGAPGVSTFYWGGDGVPNVGSLRTFFAALAAYLPNGVTVQVPSSGDILATGDGKAHGAWVTSNQAVVTGTDVNGYAGPVGALVRWQTDTFVGGRRLRGKTFIVPLANDWNGSNGHIHPGAVTAIQNAASALVTAGGGGWHIFARPFTPSAEQAASENPPAARTGSSAAITSAVVPNLTAVMRSRRD